MPNSRVVAGDDGTRSPAWLIAELVLADTPGCSARAPDMANTTSLPAGGGARIHLTPCGAP
jgi:hypothetical protein